MIVELDAYSGRPNPRWELTESDATELSRLIADLKPAPRASPPRPPGLGYRGFRLEGPAGEAYWVYGDLVRPRHSILADPDRRVETFLLEHLPAGLADLRPWLEAQIGPK